MRSRYSAFCTGNVEYLIKTCHVSNRSPDIKSQLTKTIKTTKWEGLVIIKVLMDKSDKNRGHVEFAAFYQAGKPGQLHEKSEFIHENGKWLYVGGRILPPLEFSRNQACWCRSGKKYKRCHGKN